MYILYINILIPLSAGTSKYKICDMHLSSYSSRKYLKVKLLQRRVRVTLLRIYLLFVVGMRVVVILCTYTQSHSSIYRKRKVLTHLLRVYCVVKDHLKYLVPMTAFSDFFTTINNNNVEYNILCTNNINGK